jgi:molecular chaperone GrpE
MTPEEMQVEDTQPTMMPEETEDKEAPKEENHGEIPAHQDPPIEEAISELEKVQAELEEMKDKYVRLFAEFDNYKRRSAKERLEYMKTAGQDILRDLLPVLDDIERAEKSVVSANDVDAVKEGFQLIKEKLIKNLATKGLKAMESIGEPFNADFHEAVTEIPAPSEDLKGKVVDEIEKGYLLNEKIIRYAKVVVGK